MEFAEIGRFLDTPVGNYSSGMFARLGFAVAIHVDSDIFLADEVLAVGDRPFKKKCLEQMQEVRDSGRTLFYVSHAAGSVRKMCDRVIVLEKGRLGFDGDVDEGIRYLKYDDDNAENEPDDAARKSSTTTTSSAPTSDAGASGAVCAARSPRSTGRRRRAGGAPRPTTLALVRRCDEAAPDHGLRRRSARRRRPGARGRAPPRIGWSQVVVTGIV